MMQWIGQVSRGKSLHSLCYHIPHSHALITDESSEATQGSIIGFAVVLSFLIISIFVVMLICSCYGLCKFPCKIAASGDARSLSSSSSRRRWERPMIPLPSPAPAMIKQSTSATFQNGQKLTSHVEQPLYSKLQFGRSQHPMPAAAGRAMHMHAVATGAFREDERMNQHSSTRFSVPPANAPTIMHLSQLRSHSFHSDLEQMALRGSMMNPPSTGRQGEMQAVYQPQIQQRSEPLSSDHSGGSRSNNRRMPTTWTANGNSTAPSPHNYRSVHPPRFQSKPADVPSPYPGLGFPYTPYKSPKTLHSGSGTTTTTAQPNSLTHSRLHTRRTAARQQQASASESEGQGTGGIEGEYELTDIDSVTESNSVVSSRGRLTELATSSPSYSTEV